MRHRRGGYGRRCAAADRDEEAERVAELAGIAGVEAAESGEDDGVRFGRVGHGEVVDVLVGQERFAVGVAWRARAEGAVLMLEDGLFHEGDAADAPFGDGKIIDEMTLGKVARVQVGAGGGDEFGEVAGAFGADGEEFKVRTERPESGTVWHEMGSFGKGVFHGGRSIEVRVRMKLAAGC